MKKVIAAAGLALWVGCGASAQTGPAPLYARYERSPASTPAKAVRMHESPRNEQAVQVWAESCMHERARRVDVRYQNAPDGGAAVVFTTAGDPSNLREQVLELTRVHNASDEQPLNRALYDLPHLARFERVEHGAKMTLVAEAPADSVALRRHVQQDVRTMRSKRCRSAHEMM